MISGRAVRRLLIAAVLCFGASCNDPSIEDKPGIYVANRSGQPVEIVYDAGPDSQLNEQRRSPLVLADGENIGLKPRPVEGDYCLVAPIIARTLDGDVLDTLPEGTCFAEEFEVVVRG